MSKDSDITQTNRIEQCRYYGERKNMKEVFQEYGGVIVTIIAIVSLIGVISAVIVYRYWCYD